MSQQSRQSQNEQFTSNTKIKPMTNAQRQRNWRDRSTLQQKAQAKANDRERWKKWRNNLSSEERNRYLKKERDRNAKSRAKIKKFKQAQAISSASCQKSQQIGCIPEPEELCTICFTKEKDSKMKPCMHEICWKCGDKELSNNSQCPFCREENQLLETLDGSKRKFIEKKRRHVEEDPNLFSVAHETTNFVCDCVECFDHVDEEDLVHCAFCAADLHETCGTTADLGSRIGFLCSNCYRDSEPRNKKRKSKVDPDYKLPSKRRRLNSDSFV